MLSGGEVLSVGLAGGSGKDVSMLENVECVWRGDGFDRWLVGCSIGELSASADVQSACEKVGDEARDSGGTCVST